MAHQELRRRAAGDQAAAAATYDERQWAFIEALGALLPVALAQLDLMFRRRGAVDFVALTLAAIQALGEPDAPTDLALALDYRIQHLLIDEFQDTSLSQFELLLRLTAGWQPGDGRTLFVVGDPMQSIYRFREAEVGLFLRAWHAGLGGVPLEPLALSVNFRAQAGAGGMGQRRLRAGVAAARGSGERRGAVLRVQRRRIAGLPGAGGRTSMRCVPADREREAHRVLELVRRRRATEHRKASVAVLVRSRSHLLEIVPRLKDAGLRFRAVEIEPLAGRAAVRDLYALTRALLHLADRTAWLSVLRAPWCGLDSCGPGDARRRGPRRRAVDTRCIDPQVRSALSADGAGALERASRRWSRRWTTAAAARCAGASKAPGCAWAGLRASRMPPTWTTRWCSSTCWMSSSRAAIWRTSPRSTSGSPSCSPCPTRRLPRRCRS